MALCGPKHVMNLHDGDPTNNLWSYIYDDIAYNIVNEA
jgi:hypothetical protein